MNFAESRSLVAEPLLNLEDCLSPQYSNHQGRSSSRGLIHAGCLGRHSLQAVNTTFDTMHIDTLKTVNPRQGTSISRQVAIGLNTHHSFTRLDKEIFYCPAVILIHMHEQAARTFFSSSGYASSSTQTSSPQHSAYHWGASVLLHAQLRVNAAEYERNRWSHDTMSAC